MGQYSIFKTSLIVEFYFERKNYKSKEQIQVRFFRKLSIFKTSFNVEFFCNENLIVKT
jgi:hypothetical protein